MGVGRVQWKIRYRVGQVPGIEEKRLPEFKKNASLEPFNPFPDGYVKDRLGNSTVRFSG